MKYDEKKEARFSVTSFHTVGDNNVVCVCYTLKNPDQSRVRVYKELTSYIVSRNLLHS